jgi:GLPGLI family protein
MLFFTTNPTLKKTFFALIIMIVQNSWTQNYKVTYSKSYNGKVIENQDYIYLFANQESALLTSENIFLGKSDFPYEQIFINHNDRMYIQVTQLTKQKNIALKDTTSLANQSFEITGETKIILGFTCKKAKTIINSNTIELWFTDELKAKGAPTILGQNLGLVLEMNRNGNYIISATKVEKLKQLPKEAIPTVNRFEDILTYRDLLWKSRFTTIKIFKNEIINFSGESKSNDSIMRFANGTIVLRKIKFPKINAGSQIFLGLSEQSNGDAYDRTGSVFVIPQNREKSFFDGLQNGVQTLPIYENGNNKKYQGVIATENYLPLIELMRFFTPFGIKQYNHIALKDTEWHETVPYRQDISEFHTVLSNQELWVGAFIGNYDKGGHKISMEITIHNQEKQSPKNTFVLPLFNTTNVMEMAGQEYATMFNSDKGLEVTFTLERDIKNAQLRYITTGHGGWANGDEFLPKRNTVSLNGETVFSFIPWRTECGSYRLFNPASGNFNNGLSSSDYSRSNWCPGTVTNPIFIEMGDLKAGTHTMKIQIPQGDPEGNSFSAWNISGVLLGE